MPSKPPMHAERNRSAAAAGQPMRLTTAQRGYGGRWQRYRLIFLAQHPLCAECDRQDRTTAAAVVDHIIPHKGDQELFWDPLNHQPLCDECHNRKTAREDGGFGRGLT